MDYLKKLSKKQLRNKRNSLRNKARSIRKKLNVIKSDIEDVNIEILIREIEGAESDKKRI